MNNFHKSLVVAVFKVGFLFVSSVLAETVTGVVRVIDGDTLDFAGRGVRLHGIDSAEQSQRCVEPDGNIVRPGDAAEARLASFAASGVTCTGTESDNFNRLIATCKTSDGVEINRTMVREGLAWAFVRFSRDYVPEERAAKSKRLGVWRLKCEEPWLFRQKRWSMAAQKAPEGCPIKGNISANGRIYHTPWSRHYTRTKINPERGERWFCDEGQALKAGWRPPIR